jgi:hypothetical protein
MRKVFGVLLAGLLMTLASSSAQAADPSAGPASMARFFDGRTAVFFALRIDDAYLDALSGIFNRVAEKLPSGIIPSGMLPLDLRAELDRQLAVGPVSLQDIRAALGDYAAFSINDLDALIASTNTNSPDGLAIALAVRDRAALLRLLQANIPNLRPRESGAFTLLRPTNEIVIAVGDEVMYLAPNEASLPLNLSTGSLLTNANFQDTAAAMPAGSYNLYAYLNYSTLLDAASRVTGGLQALGVTPETLALQPSAVALGATILDGSVLALDFVSNSPPVEGALTTPIKPAFAAFIPNGVDSLLWGADLQGYVDTLLETLPDTLAPLIGVTRAEAQRQIEQAIVDIRQATGVDLRRDVLAWMTSDFAIYNSVDLEPMARLLVALSTNTNIPNRSELPLEFGIVIETSDPAKTAETVTKLTTLLRSALANSPEVTIDDVNEGGLRGIELLVRAPVAGPSRVVSIDLLFGSTNEVFFFGTTKTAERLLAGRNALNDPTLARALRYAIPNQTVLLYTDSEGTAAIIGAFVAGAVLGVSTNGTSAPSAAEVNTSVLLILNTLIEVFDHMIVSGGYNANGYTVSRATIALK